jgi:Uma2 family endonuclease
MRERGWYPVVANATISYRKSLHLWQRFDVESRVIAADDRAVYLEHRAVVDGEIYALAGGSEEHSAIATRVLAALDAAIGDRPCRAHTSDLRIYVEAVGLATFPDGAVICGPLEHHAPSPNATALNPSVLVEVTSDSSEDYDHGGKLDAYRTIPSLREYIIVSHRERRIIVHHRGDESWSSRVAIAGGTVRVATLETDLVVDAIYRHSAVR